MFFVCAIALLTDWPQKLRLTAAVSRSTFRWSDATDARPSLPTTSTVLRTRPPRIFTRAASLARACRRDRRVIRSRNIAGSATRTRHASLLIRRLRAPSLACGIRTMFRGAALRPCPCSLEASTFRLPTLNSFKTLTELSEWPVPRTLNLSLASWRATTPFPSGCGVSVCSPAPSATEPLLSEALTRVFITDRFR
jgi:hypothetical protein